MLIWGIRASVRVALLPAAPLAQVNLAEERYKLTKRWAGRGRAGQGRAELGGAGHSLLSISFEAWSGSPAWLACGARQGAAASPPGRSCTAH